jgi:hypothetical protein
MATGTRQDEKKHDDKRLYERKIEAELREVQARLELIKAQAAGAAVDLRLQIERELDALRNKRSELGRRVEHLRNTGEAGWTKIREGLDHARRELADGLEVLAAKLR